MTHRNFGRDVVASPAAQRGFSLLEIAIALVVAGLMSWAAFRGYETVSAQQEIEKGRAQAQHLQSIVRTFALRHGRLPCPNNSVSGHDGYESDCAAGVQVGWFPYVSLGLEVPVDSLRARYAVFRLSANDADLAVIQERTGDSPSAATYQDVSDLIVALNNAAKLPVSSSRAYLTGDDGSAGPIDCATNSVTAAAYWIVVPLQDKDVDGDRLDTPHAIGSVCAVSPSAPLRMASDDVVVAESPLQLAGWLRKSLP